MTTILSIIEDIKAFNNKAFQTIEPIKSPYPSLPQNYVRYPTNTPIYSSIIGPRLGIYGTYYDWQKPTIFRIE